MQSDSWVVWLLFHVDFRSLQQDSIRTSKRVVPDFNRLEIWGIKLGWHLQGHGLTNALLSFAQEVYTALLAVERSLVAHSPWLSSGMFRDTLHILRIGDGIPLDDGHMAIPGTWHWLVEHDGNIVLDLHRLRHFVQKLRKRSLATWQLRVSIHGECTTVPDFARDHFRPRKTNLLGVSGLVMFGVSLFWPILSWGSLCCQLVLLKVLLNWGYHTDCTGDGFKCFMTEVSSMLTERVQYAAQQPKQPIPQSSWNWIWWWPLDPLAR